MDVATAWASSSSVPGDDGWLSPAERDVLAGLRFPKRIRDWRVGRWVAKQAVLRALGPAALSLDDVEILADPGGAPFPRILAPGSWGPVSLSLSHSGGVGFAVAIGNLIRVGCDVEAVANRSGSFLQDYLTEVEWNWVAADHGESDRRAMLVWSAKESALKVLREGLRLDTRSVEVTVPGGIGDLPTSWLPLNVHAPGGEQYPGYWCWVEDFVWTVVAERSMSSPDETPPSLAAIPRPVRSFPD
jgi:4'-phosphopantetheinyl transferase